MVSVESMSWICSGVSEATSTASVGLTGGCVVLTSGCGGVAVACGGDRAPPRGEWGLGWGESAGCGCKLDWGGCEPDAEWESCGIGCIMVSCCSWLKSILGRGGTAEGGGALGAAAGGVAEGGGVTSLPFVSTQTPMR